MLFGSTVHVPDLLPHNLGVQFTLEEGIVTITWGESYPLANVDLVTLRSAIDALDPQPRRPWWTRKRS